jgi:hypothetical protein
VSFTISYNTANPQQQFMQSLVSSVARVNAASFDSNLTPVVTNSQKIGLSSGYWQSINDAIYFNYSSPNMYTGIGTGVTAYGSVFQIRGGDVYVDNAASGVILKSAGGTCYRLYVTNGGVATTSGSVSCQ